MKKYFVFVGLFFTVVFLISWGRTGHRVVGLIAGRHLTPKAAATVKELLGSETLEDVANWADEVRNEPAYKATGPWHYINLPVGLSRQQFGKAVVGMGKPNVYEALNKQEQILADKNASREERVNALKFIVHFTGDLHQPMHVSREEDKGGNTIQVNYDGQGTNLHALWDSKLIDHTGLSEEQLVAKVDHATPQQVNEWQKDPLVDWLWESYQVSSQLYKEVDQMKSRSISEEYYKAHLPIIEERLEKAGIRLAGILNRICGSAEFGTMNAATPPPARPVLSSGTAPVKKISLSDVSGHINEQVEVSGPVKSSRDMGSMMLLNLGAAYPNQLLTVVLRGAAKKALGDLDGKNITVKGVVELYKEKPEIVVTDAAQIKVD